MEQTNHSLLPLDDHLCFSLYSTSRAIQRLYHPSLIKNELTYPQYLVLVILYEYKQLTVKALGQYLDLDSGTLTPLLKRMEKAGLLQRHRNTTDERSVYAVITEKGQKKREEAYDLPNVLLNHSHLTSEEWQTLTQLIDKLFNGITEE